MPLVTRFLQKALAVLSLGIVTACGGEIKELQRLSNLDGTVDAIVAIRETNATVATPTEIYVGAKGSKIHGEPIFRADNVDGLEVAWDESDKLIIRAKTARIFLEPKGFSIELHGDVTKKMAVELEIKDRR